MSIRSTQVVVLGAGMAGVSAALSLQSRGHQVALIDRGLPGSETSYGNAGVIQGEACEPYALPRDFATLWSIMWKRNNAVDWDIRGLLQSAPFLWSYWRQSAPQRHRDISIGYSLLTRRATADHAPLIAASDSERLLRRDGYRLVFRENAAFDLMADKAEEWKKKYGVQAVTEDSKALAAAEPALKRAMAGAILWQDAWTCSDPGELVKAYARLFRQRGGDQRQAEALSIEKSGAGWRVITNIGPIDSEHLVVALGPWSPHLLEPLGYKVPMIRKRGYHMHFAQTGKMPDRLMIDAEASAVYAPMLAGLRICSGADLSFRRSGNMPKQLRCAVKMASELLDFGEQIEPMAWSGIRPCMPDMLPVVGESPRHKGLWFNFGHGHQGFTLGPTTGELMAEMMGGNAQSEILPLLPSRAALKL